MLIDMSTNLHVHESDDADWAGHGQGLVYDTQHAKNQPSLTIHVASPA